MADVEALKKEIDTSGNETLETHEIEEFLKSEENIKKLGEAMNSSSSPELLQEMENALKDLCEKFLNLDELNDNQEKILLYFLDKFGEKYPEIKNQLGGFCEKIINKQNVNDISLTQYKILTLHIKFNKEEKTDKSVKKVANFIKKLFDNYQNELNKYRNGKGEKPNNVVAQFLEELQQEALDKINKLAEERIQEMENEMKPLVQQQRKEEERRNKLLERWRNEKKEIEELLQKDGILSEEEKQKLLYFRDYFYKEGHEQYRSNGINEEISNTLTDELGREGLRFGIVGYDKIANQIDKKLNSGLFNSIDNIIAKGELPKNTNGLKDINEWMIKFGVNNREKYEKLEGMISNEIKNIIDKTFRNEDNDKLTKQQVGIIQLWTNIKYGEDLIIDGNRGNRPFGKGKNQEVTNLYIYRLEIGTRASKKYSNILKIPNIDGILKNLRSKDSEHKIFKDFILFFLKIKEPGKYFENKIGNENLEKVLIYLVDAEKYKDITVDEYLNLRFSGDLTEEEKSQKDALKQELQQYQTIGEYFKDRSKELIKLCLEKTENLVEVNAELILQNKIKDFYKIFGDSEDPNQKEKLEKLGKEILNNPRLQDKQRKEILIMLGGKFSEIETTWYTQNIKTQKTRGYTRAGGNCPEFVKYTPGCNVKIVYDDPVTRMGPGPTGRPPIQVKIFLNEKEISLFDIIELKKDSKKIEGYDIHIDENNDLIIKKLGGDGSKLKDVFGDKIYNEYQTTQQELNDSSKEYEGILDIAEQVESDDGIKMIKISEKEKEIINNETGYTERLNHYKTVELQEARSAARNDYDLDSTPPSMPMPPKAPNYTEYHHLSIPGCEGKLVHIKPSEWNKIKELTNGKKICFNPIKKQTGKIYELTLKDLNFSEKDKDGNIHLYEINNNLSKGSEIKTLLAKDLSEANRTNNLLMTSVQMAPGLHDALDKASNLSKDLEYIQTTYSKFDNAELTDQDAEEIMKKADNIIDYLKELCTHHNDFVQLKKGLEQRYSGESDIDTESEKTIKGIISNLDYLINATVKGGDIYKYCYSMLNEKKVHGNDERYKRTIWRFKNNGIKTLLAIAGGVAAVCLVPVSGGGSLGLLQMSAIMTTGSMVGGFTGQIINEQIQNALAKPIITKSGKEIKVRYDDPTSLEMAIKGDISRKDFALETGIQFITGTATTFGCMYAGNLIGGWITKACESGKISPKFQAFLRKFNNNFKVDNGDPMTQGLFEQMTTKIGQNPKSLISKFNQSFFKEFKGELGEELFETGWEEIGNGVKKINTGLALFCSGMATLCTAWHCLTPGGNMTKIYKENGISLGDMNYNQATNALEITLDYSGDYQAIIDYYEKNGFGPPVNGHLEMPNPENPSITNIIYLRKTEISMAARTLAGQLSGYGITLDSQNGKGYYETISDIQRLELSGKANVSIDPETKKVTITSGETTLELEQKYFDGKSHKFDVNESQARSNSKMMDNLTGTINEQNKSEKIQELREKIQEQYKQSAGKEIQLTDEQILSILEAHKLPGEIGNLDRAEVRQKDEVLSQTIKDSKVRRFLLEAGFCAKSQLDLRATLSNLQKNEIEYRIRGEGNSEILAKTREEIKEADKELKNREEILKKEKNELESLKNELKLKETELEQAKKTGDKEKIGIIEEKIKELNEKIDTTKEKIKESEKAVQESKKKLENSIRGNPEIEKAKNAMLEAIEQIKKEDIPKAEQELEQVKQTGDKEKIKKAEEKLQSLKNKEKVMTDILEKIESARYGLEQLLEGKAIGEIKDKDGNVIKVVYAETIEQFLELYQLGLNEGKTTIKDENGKKTELKRKKIDETSRMLALKYYYEAIMKPLGLTIFADPSLTMENVNENFVDETHSDGFEIKESDKLATEKGKKAKEIGDNILDQIAINEGRKNKGEKTGSIIDICKNEIEKLKNGNEETTESKIATELLASIQKHGEGKISDEDQAYLFAFSMKEMADYRIAYPNMKAEQVFTLLNSNQNKLLHQHLRDLNTITSSDHGIKHVMRGNITLAENMFLQLDTKGEDGKTMREKLYEATDDNGKPKNRKDGETIDQFKARWKVLTRQAVIDHDLGYTHVANKAFDEAGFGKGFHMVSDHPLRSTAWIDNNQTFYTILFGEDGYNSLLESVPGHGNAQTQNIPKIANGNASQTEFIRGVLSCVDCAGSPGDYKIAHMFAQKEMIGGLFNAYSLLDAKNTKGAKQALTNLVETIDAMPDSGELALIKESRKKGIDAFLTNKNFNDMSPDGLKDTFKFHFNKFLGAFGVVTEIDPNTGKVKAGINGNGGFSIEFSLAGGSFEILAEKFGAGVGLKSLIGVCDDYHINDKGPTSKFLEWQTQQAINKRKEKGKDKPLKEYITDAFNHTPTESEIGQFNEYLKKKAGDKRKESDAVSCKDGIFYTGTRADDASIDFSPDRGIIMKGPNNVEITLNFDGGSYEGFNETAGLFQKIDQKTKERISQIEKEKDNPEILRSIANDVAKDFAQFGEEISDSKDWINTKEEWKPITDKIKEMAKESEVNVEKLIDEINKLRSTYTIKINKVQSSNPTIN